MGPQPASPLPQRSSPRCRGAPFDEITLRGRALPIGGLKEKVLGANRAGITTVIIPKDNEADIEDIPEEVRRVITFHLVETVDEVLAIALVPEKSEAAEEAERGVPAGAAA